MLICVLLIATFWFAIYTLLIYQMGHFFCTHLFKKYCHRLPKELVLITDFLIGFYFFGTIFFISYHRGLMDRFGCLFPQVVLGTFLIISLYLLVCHINTYSSNLKQFEITKWHLALLVLSFVCSIFIVFHYNGLINFGDWGDKFTHQQVFTSDLIASKGFPLPILIHLGMQCTLLAPAIFLPLAINHSIMMAYLFFGLINMGLILFIPFIFAKKVLNMNSLMSFFSAILVAFFGVIGAPFVKDPFLGFINISTLMYHNDTFFFAIPLCMLAIFFIYLYFVTSIEDYLSLSIIMTVISFFVKPNGYMMLGPAISMILLAKVLLKKINRRDIFNVIILMYPIVYWKLYPLYFGIDVMTANIGIKSVGFVLLHYFHSQFPMFQNNIIFSLFIILLASFAGFIIPFSCGKFKNKKENAFLYLFLIPLFIISILVCLFFVELNERLLHGNFDWQVGLIGCSLIPFTVKLTTTISNQRLRYICYFILSWAIFGAICHLFCITITGHF